MTEWDQAKVEQLIKDGTQESLTLDYKAREALSKDSKKRDEITKDVAAMANSDGGVLIYGVKEFDDPSKRYLPEKIESVDQTIITKEWLESIILNIRPRLVDVKITPVPINFDAPNGVVYVVEIPQSTTAHQSNDHKYYKRFNFMSVPMEDYEVRDVMGRGKDPKIELRFRIKKTTYTVDKNKDHFGLPRADRFGMYMPPNKETLVAYELETFAVNVGNIFAQYLVAHITVPYDLLQHTSRFSGGDSSNQRELNLADEYTYIEDNTVRDVVKGNFMGQPERSAARYVPILPGTHQSWDDLRLTRTFEEIDWQESVVKWVVYADNAQPNKGEKRIKDIKISHVDETDTD